MSRAERSSVLLGRNNSTSPESAESGQSDGSERYDCRHVYSNFRYEQDGADLDDLGDDHDPPTASYRCGSWDCYCCGYRMRMNLVEEIERVCAARPAMRRFGTLTLDPANAPADEDEQHRYLTECWNALRTALDRRFEGKVSYIWVREEGEETERAHPHLHFIVDRYIDQGWLSEAWQRAGGGEVVDIREIQRVEKAAHYLGKYLTKNALSGLPDGIRRYGSSSDISLDVRGTSEGDGSWSLVMDDWEIVDDDGDPLTRGVAAVDFVQQREWNGPVPPD